MEKELLSPEQSKNSIKLIRGQKNSYGFEIKIVGDDENEILKKIKQVNDELVKTYIELNTKEV